MTQTRMILPTLVVVVAMASAALYLHLRKQPDLRMLWRATFQIGLGVGLTRAALASLGWYGVEHTGGPLQIPAFALAMVAWPEAMLLAERRTTPVPPEVFVRLSLLLVVSTFAFVSSVAMITAALRPPGTRPSQGRR